MRSNALAKPSLTSLLGAREVVAFRPGLARALGSPLAALYLGQAMYWQKIAGDGNWWFKLRDADRDAEGNMLPPTSRARQSWEWELCMSRSQQEGARNLLRRFGLIEEDLAGVPAKLFYRVNIERIEKFVAEVVDSRQSDGEFQLTGRKVRANLIAASGQPDREIQPTNTESSQRLPKSSRRPEVDLPPSSQTEALSAAISCPGGQKKHFSFSATGVECWTDADRYQTVCFEESYGSETVRQAIENLRAAHISPLPFRVAKEVLRMNADSQKQEKLESEAKTAALAKAALATMDELAYHGKKAIKALTVEQRRSYALNYIIAAEGKEHSSSYQPATAEFKDAKERVMFIGWLHKQMHMERCNRTTVAEILPLAEPTGQGLNH